ncbi:ABC transporter permease [Phototrophicus methaneseepsis]|uniref:ABC transporter permease n=2 Tax=Phototrophicus methaneseepsis TaxID=2710758 RepID=A0A7S8EDV0_9CHLR|nr:ABC transporter permease [Phototrophicus methaneseepsis]
MENAVNPVPERGPYPQEELSIEVASQWQLMWWAFRKHHMAVIGGIVVLIFYFVAIFADFFAPQSPTTYLADYVYAPPQTIYLFKDGQFAPHVNGYTFERDPVSFKKMWAVDEETTIPIGLFVRGETYKLWGVFESNIHLIGPTEPGQPFYIFGADNTGRDVFSRTIFSSRISLSISLVGVVLSMFIGIVLGGISGLMGGLVDNLIQRLIEIALSIPMLPVIIAVAALLPVSWGILKIYFVITLLLALTGWAGLARVVRSKFLALREEDFVLAAKLDGSPPRRLILRHMLPSFYSHLIASLTLALPGMILGETALSFLGVGLRPPVVSWGVQLQEAQKINVIASYPWLLIPAFFVIVIVLAFSFLGDGLRDAADPY